MGRTRWITVACCLVATALPLAAQVTQIGGTGALGPDIAFDPDSGRYLAVWTNWAGSAGRPEGQLLDRQLQPVGPPFFVSSGPAYFLRQAAIFVTGVGGGRFVVSKYHLFPLASLEFASVDAATGEISDPVAVHQTEPALWFPATVSGGSPAGDSAVAVWTVDDPSGPDELWGVRLSIAASGAVSVSPVRVLHSASGLGAIPPAISRHGGEHGRYLVVHESGRRIFATLIDRNLSVLGELDLAPAPATSAPHTWSVDGDGTTWIVAYTRMRDRENELVCRRVTYDPVGGRLRMGSEQTVGGRAGVDEHSPDVVYLDGSYWIGYLGHEAVPNRTTTYVASIDPFGCIHCEGTLTLNASTGRADVELCTEASPALRGDAGLAAWQEGLTGSTVIQLRSLRADDGTVTDLGGGCGSGGRAQATCAITGHAGFSHWLSEATPSAASLLVLSTRQTALTCGSCTLVADPTAGVAVSTATDNFGEAAVPMPIPASPSLVGVEFVEQWLVLGTGGCAGLGFSHAIQLEIE